MPLSEAAVEQGAALLLEARSSRFRLSDWPLELRPQDQRDAERICTAMARGFEQPVTGWKVGALDPSIAVKRGLERPFCGQVPHSLIYASEVALPWQDLLRPVVEAEIVFRMGTDLSLQSSAFSRQDVIDAIECVIPAIEIPESRLIDGHPLGALGMVADQGFAGRLVLGHPIMDWHALDLTGTEAELTISKQVVARGSGARAMGEPLRAVQWLANFLRERGRGLRAGQVISTGSLTGIQMTRAGDRVAADFGRLGVVRLAMV